MYSASADEKICNVYFNDVGDTRHVFPAAPISLATLLNSLTLNNDQTHFSICLDGYGLLGENGARFSYAAEMRLEKQVGEVAKKINNLLAAHERMILNVFGFGRGGVGVLMLCQKLKQIDASRLKINIVAYDPAPGNYITVAYWDMYLGYNLTLSSAVENLTGCHIERALILFTNHPTSKVDDFAPILSRFSSSTQVEIDVMPGCYRDAVSFKVNGKSIRAENDVSVLSFHRVIDFMRDCGTLFDFTRYALDRKLLLASRKQSDELLQLYQSLKEMTAIASGRSQRAMQLRNTIFTMPNDKRKYLNRYHQVLLGVEDVDDGNCLLTIQDRYPESSLTEHYKVVMVMELVMILAVITLIHNRFFKESPYSLRCYGR